LQFLSLNCKAKRLWKKPRAGDHDRRNQIICLLKPGMVSIVGMMVMIVGSGGQHRSDYTIRENAILFIQTIQNNAANILNISSPSHQGSIDNLVRKYKIWIFL
jgi:hypothetical protein